MDRDLHDVEAILVRRLTTVAAIKETFAAIEPDLYRFPAVDVDELRSIVEALTATDLD